MLLLAVAMLGWQLSYFTNVCTVQLEVSFTPHGDRTSKLQQELMLQYNIIFHCDTSTTSATANLTRCIKTTLHPTAL